jgi:hypothetical protein
VTSAGEGVPQLPLNQAVEPNAPFVFQAVAELDPESRDAPVMHGQRETSAFAGVSLADLQAGFFTRTTSFGSVMPVPLRRPCRGRPLNGVLVMHR